MSASETKSEASPVSGETVAQIHRRRRVANVARVYREGVDFIIQEVKDKIEHLGHLMKADGEGYFTIKFAVDRYELKKIFTEDVLRDPAARLPRTERLQKLMHETDPSLSLDLITSNFNDPDKRKHKHYVEVYWRIHESADEARAEKDVWA